MFMYSLNSVFKLLVLFGWLYMIVGCMQIVVYDCNVFGVSIVRGCVREVRIA